MKTVKGHYLSDWGDNIKWQGAVKVMAKGEKMWLDFVDLKDGKLFAKCILPQKIELVMIPTVDSSRA